MSGETYEKCLCCGEDVRPCTVPDRCYLTDYRHVATGRHLCAIPLKIGVPFALGAYPGHEEPGWKRSMGLYRQRPGWVREAQ